MKHLLITTIAAVLVVGCGSSVPDISIHKAAGDGNIEAVKQHITAGADVNAKDKYGYSSPLQEDITVIFCGDNYGKSIILIPIWRVLSSVG
jgi:predicted component of type VI protein secretion system